MSLMTACCALILVHCSKGLLDIPKIPSLVKPVPQTATPGGRNITNQSAVWSAAPSVSVLVGILNGIGLETPLFLDPIQS